MTFTGVGGRALVSQALFSAASIIGLGAIARASTSDQLGFAVVAIAVQAVANSLLRGLAVNALMVYRADIAAHPEDRRLTVSAFVLLGGTQTTIILLLADLGGAKHLDSALVYGIAAWQLLVLATDTVRAYRAFMGSRWALQVGLLVLLVCSVATLSAINPSQVHTLMGLSSLYAVLGGLLLMIRSRANVESGAIGLVQRLSVARESLWIALTLSGSLAIVGSHTPGIAAAWQVVSQALASPIGYVATAVNAASTRRLVGEPRLWRTITLRWLVVSLAMTGAGIFVGRTYLLSPFFLALVGPVWTSGQDVLLPCLAYMTHFQLLFIVAILLRLRHHRGVDLFVLILSAVAAASFALLAIRSPAQLNLLWILPGLTSLVIAGLALAGPARASN